ncbi:MAG: hypothetical protein PHW74_10560 [Desulfobacca sp.]|nr:hypothetical protein [Desulfobacca sp.]
MRIPQPQGDKGSLKWIQIVINDCPEILNREIKSTGDIHEAEKITWVSPLRQDDYAEYRDNDFLDRLDIKLNQRSLNQFWPERGPQWDGLGKSESGELFLVEAKAHIEELFSQCQAASEKSRSLISASLNEVRQFLGVDAAVDWSQVFYQYTNRLAHLYLLRQVNRLPAFLVNVYFCGDDMNGPKTSDEWRAALKVLKGVLVLGMNHKLRKYVVEAFVDVKEIKSPIA